uniref:Secreted protein n=1 Tax=Noctiluca scintillans TaxID=2966 RepID=A0A7S1F9C3_NOCSC|mmetsp:Transcript_42958/g.113183  ORF Transcript_42958/g.113183 Transcript_42958/m.113183 type:complete len:132 (+) Transcript_42958:43-438(+)|eukprot:CAMPEP_0194521084 /NCGR_PEP_ID=MMETSP0253-20130528/55296_1 /TAXON_ID=2966 /ORGANISM="Noctiluca scintillans" /LENGTH=131 /DNA_ID=CAMNT_0039365407 /DNA_START=10 /DNA_END=405 /DNA_ORIENTATION=+
MSLISMASSWLLPRILNSLPLFLLMGGMLLLIEGEEVEQTDYCAEKGDTRSRASGPCEPSNSQRKRRTEFSDCSVCYFGFATWIKNSGHTARKSSFRRSLRDVEMCPQLEAVRIGHVEAAGSCTDITPLVP